MFKTKLANVVNLFSNQDLLKRIVENNAILTPKSKYLFSRLLEVANSEIEKFEKIRIEKVTEYGTDNEEGQKQILPDNPNMAKFQKEMQEILDTEIEFIVNKIKASDINVDMKDQFLINWMLEE